MKNINLQVMSDAGVVAITAGFRLPIADAIRDNLLHFQYEKWVQNEEKPHNIL